MAMSKDLKPCPFCGGEPVLDDLGDADSHFVRCSKCEVQQIAKHMPWEAAERWNERTSTPPLTDEAMRERVWEIVRAFYNKKFGEPPVDPRSYSKAYDGAIELVEFTMRSISRPGKSNGN